MTNKKTFYTNAFTWGNNVLYRGIRNGHRITEKVGYQPSLFVSGTNPNSPYKTIKGSPLERIDFSSLSEAKDFLKSYKDVENFKIYGNTRFEYSCIDDMFPDKIDFGFDDLHIIKFDIETESKNGFPQPDQALEKVTAITLISQLKGKRIIHVLGYNDFKNDRKDVIYYKCRDEIDLLRKFITIWSMDYPDIVTGWNQGPFDIPYMVNRITKILGEKEVKKLSPWGIVQSKEVRVSVSSTYNTYLIKGVALLDYEDLYKWFAPDGKSQESYKLDDIAFVEIGQNKVDHDEYQSLDEFYEKDYQKFMEYNIQDTELIDWMENKLKLIELIVTVSYLNKCNFEDVFTQVRMWTAICANYLKKRNIYLDHSVHDTKSEKYEGAYVKEPLMGLHKLIASFDFKSLYPSIIMSLNISPETLVEPEDYPDDIREWMSSNTINVQNLLDRKIDTSILKKYNYALSPNGQLYRRDFKGFIPDLVEDIFNVRDATKQEMLTVEQKIETLKTENKNSVELENLFSSLNNLQLAEKVNANSIYGAIGNEFFVLYDLRNAVAITTGAQLATKSVIKYSNEFLSYLKGEEKDFVLAADTDSAFFVLSDFCKDIKGLYKFCEQILQPKIKKICANVSDDCNFYSNRLNMKREKLATAGIWAAKKHYAINVNVNEKVVYAEPHLKITGLEAIKSSTPKFCRQKIKECYKIILENDEDTLINFIEKFREEFDKAPIETIALPRGVNGINEYSDKKTVYKIKTPAHTRGTILYNKLIKDLKLEKKYEQVKDGNKIKFIWLKEPNPIGENIIAFTSKLPPEFGLDKFVDRKAMFEKSFLKPVQALTDTIGWETERKDALF